LRVHKKRIDLGNHGDCRYCGDEEEISEHLLCECDAVSNIRTNLFGNTIITDRDISSLKPTQLLAFIKEAGGVTVMRLASVQPLVTTAVNSYPDSYKSTNLPSTADRIPNKICSRRKL